MSDKSLPDQPNLEQYKKQAKDLLHAVAQAAPGALNRIARHYGSRSAPFQLADAQHVIAREHGFESWPKFARHVQKLRLTREVDSLSDPVAAFIEAACVPLHAHSSGTLDEAEMILARYPHIAASSIHTAAVIADEATVRAFLTHDPLSATVKGGPLAWDALTHLCFSRYLRLDRARSDAFVRTARALLDAGASANTGWIEMIDHPNPRPIVESAIYGAAGIAQHAELTRLLLERGADPNDEETPYHVIETFDNTVLKILLESGKLNARSLSTLLHRKCDWHDLECLRAVLEHGVDPNRITGWGHAALHQAVRRDNSLNMIELLLDYGANPALPNRDGKSAIAMAARRGRAAAVDLFERRGTAIRLANADALIAACARDHKATIRSLIAAEPQLKSEVIDQGGTLLAEFSGVGNLAGVRNLLDLGVSVTSLYREGDGYFGIAKNSTALHVAAWRAWPEVVKELIARGAPVKHHRRPACVDSYWTERRSPDSVCALLEAGTLIDRSRMGVAGNNRSLAAERWAGASTEGIELPSGYDEVDKSLQRYDRATDFR